MGGGPRGNRERYAERRYFPVSQPRKTLDDYDNSTKPRVFISFHVDDEAQVNLLRRQAKTSDQLEFVDYSVKEPFDEKWKTQCTERIRQSTIVVVAIGENTHQREAVDWEIRKAHELGKPVIGMRISSDKNHKIPKAMVEHGDRVVPWKLETIQSELDRARKES
jgi:DNA-directed RNA polymerase subunit L